MDNYDRKIIRALRENARTSLAEIGRRVGLSRSAVAERVERLEQSGVVNGYSVRLGGTAAAGLQAYFQLTFSPFHLHQLAPRLRSIPELTRIHALSGEIDLMLFAEVESMDRLNQIRGELERLPDLKRLLTCPVLESL
ncbi:MAG: Lrp/AsnC family transcriptional regulator [Gammaproteobacteria bacterium]|nr:Lrp/AsnC family transcriptional regulator [Gammaproteobacteria bacterium]